MNKFIIKFYNIDEYGCIVSIPNHDYTVWNPFPKGLKEANHTIRMMSIKATDSNPIQFELKETDADNVQIPVASGRLVCALTCDDVPTTMFRAPTLQERGQIRKNKKKANRAAYSGRNHIKY